MRFHLRSMPSLLVAALALSAACNGNIGDPPGGGSGPSVQTLSMIGVSGARRLTAVEYDATVNDLLGDTSANSILSLPVDRRMPFDNDYTAQTASQALIEGAELLAGAIADKLDTDTARRDTVVGCVPNGTTDPVCFDHFVRTFGRRALRHTLAEAEVASFMKLQDSTDFYVGINSAIRAFLQHPEFLYRIEVGTPVAGQDGVFKLADTEVATRLSYFLIGSTPPDWLLDAAEGGTLATDDDARAATQKLLDDPRARTHTARFHALWLGWEATASADAQTETGALLDKVIFDDQGVWQDLLRSDQTYVNASLAQTYGMSAPTDAGFSWQPWDNPARQGLLSEGAFLSLGTKFSDTSPTQRGLLVRTRLFCQTIDKPPPGVNIDMPPGMDPNACKLQRYDMSTRDDCKGCHAQMDPIGFGLENYDASGAYRTFQPNRPDCPIDGQGTLAGVGAFNGPKQLSDLLIQSGDLNTCIVTQLYRFAMGRYDLDSPDFALITKITEGANQGGDILFEKALLDFLSSSSFRYRRNEPDPGQ